MMIRKLKRGFTLVELMIVVAIIGVLAALAIVGVRKYVANAKTAEARGALGRLGKDAVTAYNRENMAGTALNVGEVAGASNVLCGSVTAPGELVPADVTKIKGQKYQSSPAEWMTGTSARGWHCLKFSMDSPQYYQYGYTQTGSVSDETGAFNASAQGDLNGDGVLSTFGLAGRIVKGATGGLAATVAPNLTEANPEE